MPLNLLGTNRTRAVRPDDLGEGSGSCRLLCVVHRALGSGFMPEKVSSPSLVVGVQTFPPAFPRTLMLSLASSALRAHSRGKR